MWPGLIIVEPPAFDDLPRFGQAAEQMFVQALVAQAAVETFDKGILDGFAGLDIVPRHATGNPSQDCRTSQFGTIITDYYFRYCALIGETLEFAHHRYAAEGSSDPAGQAFPTEVVDHAQDPKAAPRAERVADKIEAPALIYTRSRGQRCSCSPSPLAPTAPSHQQLFFSVQAI